VKPRSNKKEVVLQSAKFPRSKKLYSLASGIQWGILLAAIAILGAGGKGKRMGAGKNKCLMELLGKPIISWTALVFERCAEIGKIIVVCGEGEEEEFKTELGKEGITKLVSITQGGNERQDSMWNGLREAGKAGAKKGDLILFHNGANPLVLQEEILEGMKAAKEFGASVLAQPCKDTIKTVNEKTLLVKKTLNRKELWAMQTPQIIEYELAMKAFGKAMEEKFYGTDDVQLVERYGGKVKIVQCGYENIRLVTPDDIIFAERVMEKRRHALSK